MHRGANLPGVRSAVAVRGTLNDPSDEEVERLQAVMTAWIEEQDQLDRKRNHFLKAFRGKHGARRADYDPQLLAEFEAGLDAVNAEVSAARAVSAARLLKNSA